ncbi:hypothetical protein BC628DRAFT_1500564 [Trametes gibbosa]|nr:hypothetical protein BC628DRAFT_1500564 [Trametes gibbosa]
MHSDGDEQLRRPQSWSALNALESLSPPSPSPSGSLGDIATCASLGDLPIFLHTSDDSVPQDLNLAVAVSQGPEPPCALFLAPSGSTTSFQSTNTFGVPSTRLPQCDIQDYTTPDDASDSTARQSIAQPSPPNPAYLSAVRSSRSAGYFSNRFASISDLSHFTISAYAEPWASSDNLSASASPSGIVSPFVDMGPVVSPSGSIIVSSPDGCLSIPTSPSPLFETSVFASTDNLPGSAPSHLAPTPSSRSWSALSSVLFNRRTVSTSSSITSTLASADNSPSRKRFRFPLKSSGKSRSPSTQPDLGGQMARSPSPAFGNPSCSTPASPLTSQFSHHPSPVLVPSASCGRSSGSGSGCVHPRLSPIVPNLPEVLGWLRDTVIELWIDQEGFRAIQPKFHLTAYSSPPPPPSSMMPPPASLVDTLTDSLAVFQPVRPQRSVYHHSAFDSAPVLRRLTVAGNEEKDYISRQASLTLKENGVYAVCGAEAFEDHPPHGQGHGTTLQLKWRFEYVVDDLRTGGGGASGEKTFVPLSFSCSPGLLHASHGKRVKLMHVLMKNITPKLSAKRAAADGKAKSIAFDVHDPLQEMPELHSDAPRLSSHPRHMGLSAHRRTRSSDPSRAPAWAPADNPAATKRVRPASVCASDLPPLQPALPSAEMRKYPPFDASTWRTDGSSGRSPNRCGRTHAHTQSTDSSRLSAYILSPGELAQILDAFPRPDSPSRVAYRARAHLSTPLSPPSYYRHRRAGSEMERVDELGALVE